MNINYIFNSKETYLNAAKAWKENYAKLTIEARELRKQYNEAQSVFSKTPLYNNNTAYWAAFHVVEKARSARASLREEANEALADRFAMKEEARTQWEAAKLQPVE